MQWRPKLSSTNSTTMILSKYLNRIAYVQMPQLLLHFFQEVCFTSQASYPASTNVDTVLCFDVCPLVSHNVHKGATNFVHTCELLAHILLLKLTCRSCDYTFDFKNIYLSQAPLKQVGSHKHIPLVSERRCSSKVATHPVFLARSKLDFAVMSTGYASGHRVHSSQYNS